MATIILTGGGTAGHVIPNLNLIPLLQEKFDRIIYIGSENGIEKDLVSKYHNVEYYPITTTKLKRSLSFKNLLIPFRLIKGTKQAKSIIAETLPNVIFSKGGFVSLPVVLAGKKMHIPMVAHESDLSVGLANRLVKRKFKVICTTFPETAQKLKNGIYTGPPIEKATISEQEKTRFRQKYNLTSKKPICLVIGGSLGATAINDAITSCLDTIIKTHQVFHITGKNKATQIKKDGYHQAEFITEMPTLLSITDIAITRGGSNAIWELLLNNIPMIIIPLSKGSRGDQIENAEYFASKNYALKLDEKDLTPHNLIKSYTKLVKISNILRNSNKHALPPNALHHIYNEIVKHSKT